MLVGVALSWLLMAATLTVDSAGAARRPRQAGRVCGAGESCMPLRECRPLLTALANPTAQVLDLISRALCRGRDATQSVCCAGVISFGQPPIPSTTLSPGSGGGHVLLPQTCGQTIGPSAIYYGTEAQLGYTPWMALLGYKDRSDPIWACGGSLITAQYVLTAAHCLIPFYTGDHALVVVRLGEHDLTSDRDCQGSIHRCAPPHQDFAPAATLTHPDFNVRAPVSDDLGLVKLDRPATLNAFVQPVCLPPPDLDVGETVGVGGKVVVAGWGTNEDSNTSSSVLRHEFVPLISLEDCRRRYNDLLLMSEQMCLSGEVQHDICIESPGGPAFVERARDFAGSTVLGVMSVRPPHCDHHLPSLYTSVARYLPWITANLRP